MSNSCTRKRMCDLSKACSSLDPQGLELFTVNPLLLFPAEACPNITLAILNVMSYAGALLQRSTWGHCQAFGKVLTLCFFVVQISPSSRVLVPKSMVVTAAYLLINVTLSAPDMQSSGIVQASMFQHRYREVTTPDRAQASITCGLAPVRLNLTKRKHKAVRIRPLQDYCILKRDTYEGPVWALPRLYTCHYQGRTLIGVIGVQTVCTSYSFGSHRGRHNPCAGTVTDNGAK